MKDIDWNHPKYAANAPMMQMAWGTMIITTIAEGYMEKYFPYTFSIMQQFKAGGNL